MKNVQAQVLHGAAWAHENTALLWPPGRFSSIQAAGCARFLHWIPASCDGFDLQPPLYEGCVAARVVALAAKLLAPARIIVVAPLCALPSRWQGRQWRVMPAACRDGEKDKGSGFGRLPGGEEKPGEGQDMRR